MKIAIDARCLQRSKGKGLGVARVLVNLLKNIPTIGTGHEFVVYLSEDEDLLFDVDLSDPIFTKRVMKENRLTRYGLLWENIVLPWALNRDRPDALLSPSYTTPLLFTDVPRFTIVHDISYRTLKGHFSLRHRLTFDIPSLLSCKVSRLVFTVSEFSKREIIKHYKIDGDKISVVHSGVEGKFRPLEENKYRKLKVSGRDIPENYILYIGSIFNRRNVEKLLSAYGMLKKTDDPPALVIVGENKTFPVIDIESLIDKINSMPGGGKIFHLDFVGDEDLLSLYQQCEVFVYPSSYEGFGLPVLEALACGKPVITGDSTCFTEIAGGDAVFVDPKDEGQIRGSLIKILKDDHFRTDLAARGLKRAALFDWGRSATKYINIIEHALGGGHN
jgi:glycosyltransferase involved in cell wall biosynthesis